MVDLPRKRKQKQSGWRTVIRRGEFIPCVVRRKGLPDLVIRFGVAADGNHVIDAPREVAIIAPDRRPRGRK